MAVDEREREPTAEVVSSFEDHEQRFVRAKNRSPQACDSRCFRSLFYEDLLWL